MSEGRDRWKTTALPPHNKKIAAFAHFVRSGERGTEAAPATSERYPQWLWVYLNGLECRESNFPLRAHPTGS